MLLAIDVGNTNITLGVFENDGLIFTARLATDRHRTGDQYAVEIRDIIHIYGISAKDISGAIISSVVPNVSSAISSAVTKLCNITPIQLGPGIKTGLDIKIDDPAQLGADFVAGAVGAVIKYPLPSVVIDLGTATTLGVLDKNGAFIGAVITPGVGLSVEALTQNTSLLPSINIEAPKSVIGKNSVDCIKSGIVLGTASMLDGMIDRIEEELGETVAVIATGGRAKQIISNCKHGIILDDNLLLDGLKLIYERNCQ